MEAITIKSGYKTAVVSQWGAVFVVNVRNGGRNRQFKTLAGAMAFAQRYVA